MVKPHLGGALEHYAVAKTHSAIAQLMELAPKMARVKNLVLDVFVVWRVADPLRFLQSVGDTVGAEARLHDLVWSELAATLGNYELTQLVCVRPEGERNGKSAPLAALTDTVWERCRVTAMRLYGIELVDVRLKRLLFPEQNREAVFARMRAERERIAQRYLAEGVLHRRER